MPWDTEENKPPDSPPTRAGLLRSRLSRRRRCFDRYIWTPNTGEIVSQARGRLRLQPRLSDFIFAVLCLWTFVADVTLAESVTNASSTSMANSTGVASPTVGPEAVPNQTPNRPMESSLNKVFYSALLFLLVPLVSYVTAILIKIICPIAKTPGSFCCPKYQIGDSGEVDAEADKAGKDEQRVKNAILLLFTIDVNEEKEEEEELKEIEKAMKRLKERRLRKMRNMMRQRAFHIGASEDSRKMSTAFLPPGEAQLITKEDAPSEREGVTQEDNPTDSNPVENVDHTHTKPTQEECQEATQRRMDPIANNPSDTVNIKENKALSNSSLIENMPPQYLQTVGGSGSASKTKPFKNNGPSCAVTNPPVSTLDATSTEHEQNNWIPNPTENIKSVDMSGASNSNSSSCTVEVDVKKNQRNLSTISSTTVTLMQNKRECNDSIPANKSPIGNNESKEVVFKDKEQPVKQPAFSPVTDQSLQKQKDGNTRSSSPAENNRPVIVNYQGTSDNLAHEMSPETKTTAKADQETRQVPACAAANQTRQTVNTDILEPEHKQANTKVESVNIHGSDQSLRSLNENIASHTCSNSGERIPRGQRKEEATGKSERGSRSTLPLKVILVQTENIS